MRLSKELESQVLALAAERGAVVTPTEISREIKRGPNKTEVAYMRVLEDRLQLGIIKAFGFEEIKLKIGVKRCWYTPDFWVVESDGRLCFHETKGFMRDDARVKIQSAAKQYPQFGFVVVRKVKGGWDTEIVQ